MPRRKSDPKPEPEETPTDQELAELDDQPEANEGNESAMAGRENPDA
jgi:hypothetical protein